MPDDDDKPITRGDLMSALSVQGRLSSAETEIGFLRGEFQELRSGLSDLSKGQADLRTAIAVQATDFKNLVAEMKASAKSNSRNTAITVGVLTAIATTIIQVLLSSAHI